MPEQHDPSQAAASTAPSAAVESAPEDPEPDPDASAVSIPSGARLVLATHNAGKLAELRAMIAAELPGLDVERAVVDAGSLGLPDVRETGTTFQANALLKAHAAAEASGLPAVADDSGLACLLYTSDAADE